MVSDPQLSSVSATPSVDVVISSTSKPRDDINVLNELPINVLSDDVGEGDVVQVDNVSVGVAPVTFTVGGDCKYRIVI